MKISGVCSLTFCAVAFAGLALAQTPEIEYGKANELRGVKTIYVFTDKDLEVHDNIVKNILKKLPNLIITDEPEQADVVLIFAATAKTFFAGMSGSGTISKNQIDLDSTADYRTITQGWGQVIRIVGKDPIRFRILMQFTDSSRFIWERRTSTNFARAFVKACEAANAAK
jgi:hypothetical protein